MKKHIEIKHPNEALDEEILLELSAAQAEITIPESLRGRMRSRLQNSVKQELAGKLPGFETLRNDEGEWIEAAPGGFVKILHSDPETSHRDHGEEMVAGIDLHAARSSCEKGLPDIVLVRFDTRKGGQA